MTTILLIGAGGFIGANLRYAMSVWSAGWYGARFPFGTLIANLTGSFLIGLVLSLIDDRELQLLLATGFLGAETTFSTFAIETVALAERGERARAALNVVANAIGSLGAVAAGIGLAEVIGTLR